MGKSKILIIEDNADTRKFLEAKLGKDFVVLTADNGVIGIEYARNRSPDLILLDILLPVLSGYDVCNLLKKDEKTNRIPIIILSTKTSIQDITQGFAQGADDYISQPFNYKEFLARIQTRLRKTQDEITSIIVSGELKIDQSNREITFEGKKIELTLTEHDILRLLVLKSGSVVSREAILKEVWRDHSTQTQDRTIDVHIRAIRKKIPSLSKHILSVYGIGYQYEP